MGEWISVQDRLPEFRKQILLFCVYKVKRKKFNFVTIGILDRTEIDEKGQHNRFEGYSEKCGDITHWMPLPEAPIA